MISKLQIWTCLALCLIWLLDRTVVELAIPCEKPGLRVFEGFTVGFHPRSWEIVRETFLVSLNTLELSHMANGLEALACEFTGLQWLDSIGLWKSSQGIQVMGLSHYLQVSSFGCLWWLFYLAWFSYFLFGLSYIDSHTHTHMY